MDQHKGQEICSLKTEYGTGIIHIPNDTIRYLGSNNSQKDTGDRRGHQVNFRVTCKYGKGGTGHLPIFQVNSYAPNFRLKKRKKFNTLLYFLVIIFKITDWQGGGGARL